MFVCPICGNSKWGTAVIKGISHGYCNGFRRFHTKFLRCHFTWDRLRDKEFGLYE